MKSWEQRERERQERRWREFWRHDRADDVLYLLTSTGLSYGAELHAIAHAIEAIGRGLYTYGGGYTPKIDGRGWRVERGDDGVVTVTLRIAIDSEPSALTDKGPED